VSDVCISTVTRAELRYGICRKPEAISLQRTVATFLEYVVTFDWNIACADVFGVMRAQIEKKGINAYGLDLMIAAHAIATNCALVTNNKIFKKIADLEVVDWSIKS